MRAQRSLESSGGAFRVDAGVAHAVNAQPGGLHCPEVPAVAGSELEHGRSRAVPEAFDQCCGKWVVHMAELPLIIVAGGDDLALRVCEELCRTRGHRVVLLWEPDAEVQRRAEAAGAAFAGLPPNDYDSLRSAGVEAAATVMPVGADDRQNLQIALKARDLQPGVRLVLRQFNRSLGRKIEQNLEDCTVVSPASHAAATYAAAALDPDACYGVQFPDLDGPLFGFSERTARAFGLADTWVGDAERRLGLRIVALNGRVAPERSEEIREEDRLIAAGPVEALYGSRPRVRRSARRRRFALRRVRIRESLRAVLRGEPLLLYSLSAGTLLFIAATIYFMARMRLTFIEAMYFTTSTMLTVGYGDITPYTRHAGTAALLVAIVVMLTGVIVGGIFIGSVSSALTRAQETALQGLRPIRAEGHVVVCGSGNVGTRVIEYLMELGTELVVVERNPSALLLQFARSHRIELLRGDATDDETLRFCAIRRAHSLVAVTDSDTANLEAALGALVRNPELPTILRIMDPGFSQSAARNFAIARSFSAIELVAPTIAGLARFPGTRGRFSFAEETFNVSERSAEDGAPSIPGAIPLFLHREKRLIAVRDFSEMRAGDRALYLVPLTQFRPDA